MSDWVMVPRDCTDEIAEAICGQVNVCGGIAESIWRAAVTASQAAQPAEADGVEPSDGAGVPAGEPKSLGYHNMGASGRCDWTHLREAVAEAVSGSRAHSKPFDPAYYPGHQQVQGINYNSLDRIVTAFVDAALAATPKAPATDAGEVEKADLATIAYMAGRYDGRKAATPKAPARCPECNDTSPLPECGTCGVLPPRKAPATDAGEVERLAHVIDRDRYAVAACVGAIEHVLHARRGLREAGRGSYAYDDERYQEEFGLAYDEIQEALRPMRALSKDKTDCTRDEDKVKAARAAGAEKFATLATPPAPNDDLRAALEKIAAAASNHCVCCTMMGKTARAALSQPLAVDTGQSGEAQRSLICLTPGCRYSTEIKTSYSHSSYGNARVSVTALFPSWQSLKVDTPEQLNYVEHVLHHHMEKAVAEIGRYDLALGGTMAQEWPATPPAPNDDLRAALERLNTAVEHDEYLDGVRIDHGDALQILAALKENRRG